MGFPRQMYWSELPFPSPEDLPDPGIKPGSPAWQVDSFPMDSFPGRDTMQAHGHVICGFTLSETTGLFFFLIYSVSIFRCFLNWVEAYLFSCLKGINLDLGNSPYPHSWHVALCSQPCHLHWASTGFGIIGFNFPGELFSYFLLGWGMGGPGWVGPMCVELGGNCAPLADFQKITISTSPLPWLIVP